MIGSLVGDMVGSVYEWKNIKMKDFPLFATDCFFTDDSILTIALADTLLSGTPYAENMRRFYRWYPDGGYGGSFRQWARSANPKPYNSWGNGAAMRISPVGYAFDDMETVLRKAEEFTAITHNHPEGIKGGQSVAAAIFLARTGQTKEEIQRYIESRFGYHLSRHVDEIRPTYTFDVSSQGTVPQAIRAFLDSTDFEDAIRTAISLGGDSDTVACITGGIAQAFYRNVPNPMQSAVYRILDDRLGDITLRFMQKYCEFCCETSAVDASLMAIEDEMAELLTEWPDSETSENSGGVFERYAFRFRVGETVFLKTRPDYLESLGYVHTRMEEDGLSKDLSWIPSEQMVRELASVPMTIFMANAYHCGYPLYFVRFTHKGQSCDYRFCEAFLTKIMPSPSESRHALAPLPNSGDPPEEGSTD